MQRAMNNRGHDAGIALRIAHPIMLFDAGGTVRGCGAHHSAGVPATRQAAMFGLRTQLELSGARGDTVRADPRGCGHLFK
jgi:hypothetical protein